jgi:hypothetical protein
MYTKLGHCSLLDKSVLIQQFMKWFQEANYCFAKKIKETQMFLYEVLAGDDASLYESETWH